MKTPNDSLQTIVDQHDNLEMAGKALGFSANFLSMVLRDRRKMSPRLAAKLGWEKRETWVRKRKP